MLMMRWQRWLAAGLGVVLAVWVGIFIRHFLAIEHDKAVNADSLQRLRNYGGQLPLGVVIPAGNRWASNAFVAEKSDEAGDAIAVVLLDDHYQGSDPIYGSAGGLIGDKISTGLFCSLPRLARQQNVILDPAVEAAIQRECLNV